ncbi:MAG: undecaprenyl/decaprenyl-phosphate alpha-N-acetylglucosaminyl 1-phosphate transferase, partial [Gemmatimonadetes bacterium]|nr:undecaprenyl/decaprenyl-phosphate alpha-N-acetylglucosaminyl 1-phosphate transferase [Gemmatimonadota bacterium]
MSSFPFVWLFAVTFLATLAAMPLARALGARLGLMDHPHQRKLQTTAVPRTGGIGILLGLTAGTFVLLHLSAQLGIPVSRELIALFAGGVILHVTGVLDDLYDIPAKVKLAAQAAAVGVVISQGVVLERLIFPGGASWEFGMFAAPITAFFLLGFINAINLVDGLDGLASGIVGIGALALGTAGVMGGNYLLAGLSTIVFAAVLGFLPFNFRKE